MRLGKDAKVELIRNVPLFSRLSRKGLQEVASIADEIDFSAGKVLTKQGARGREFIVILEGAAKVEQDGKPINTLGEGDFFGEIALVTKLPRTATVTATQAMRALVITDRDFLTLMKKSSDVGEGVVEAMGERLAPELS
jgi:CRP-like cAMP-binding protein